MNLREQTFPHPHGNGNKETGQRRAVIRDELIAWLPKATSGKDHPPTQYTQEEAERYVDWIFAIEDDGSVTVKNILLFGEALETAGKAPPFVKIINGDLSLSLIRVHSLDWLQGVTIKGNLYLPKDTHITSIPEDIIIQGKIFAGENVSQELIDDVQKKYKEKFVSLRHVDHS